MRDFAPIRFRSADQRLDLHARDYPVAVTAGQGGGAKGLPLLLLHGLTRNSADFEPLVAHLPGYRLIVPDQRGRGRSAYDAEPVNYRVDVYAADMFALLDALGLERVAIVGTSMGGLIGMVMAAMAPDRIAALALNDIGPMIDSAGLDRIRGYVGPAIAAKDWAEMAKRVAAINGDAFPDFAEADWHAFSRRTAREEAGGIVADYDPAIAVGMAAESGAVVPADLWPLWDALSALPVLVLRGERSDLLAAATVAQMGERHDGPFAAVEVPRRGHAPLLDEPAVLAALTPFLASHAR